MAHGSILGQKLEDALLVDGSKSMKANLNMNNHKITNVTNGTSNADAVNYSQLQTKLDLSGGIMTGPINMGNNKITNVANGTANTDIATVGQVNTIANAALDNLTPSTVYTNYYNGWDLGFVPWRKPSTEDSLVDFSNITALDCATNGTNTIIVNACNTINDQSQCMISNDNGTTWSQYDTKFGYIVYKRGYFYSSTARGISGESSIYRSSNGTSWSRVETSGSSGNGKIMGYTDAFIIGIETDTAIGSPSYSYSSNFVYAATNGNNGNWEQAGNSITINSRANITIYDCTKTIEINGFAVATDYGLYFQNTYSRSNSWSSISRLGSGDYMAVAYWNGNFYFMDSLGQLFRSNSSTLSTSSSSYTSVGNFSNGVKLSSAKIIAADNYLVVAYELSTTSADNPDCIMVSSDGTNWSKIRTAFTYGITGCYGNNTVSLFTVGGANGTLEMRQAATNANIIEKALLSITTN